MGMTAEDLLAAGPQITSTAVLQPIGVPPDYSAHVEYQPGVTAPIRPGGIDVPARYYEGDDWAPAALSTEEVASLQRDLVNAGLIPQGTTYRPGIWDDTSRAAYRDILSYANASGLSADVALRVWADSHKDEKPKNVAAYLEPDYATLAQTVKSTMRSALKRDPTDQELQQLTSRLSGESRADYDAQTAATIAQQDALAVGEQAPATQDVDPVARFNEYVEQRYKPEIQRTEAIADLAHGRENLMGSIFAIDQAIG